MLYLSSLMKIKRPVGLMALLIIVSAVAAASEISSGMKVLCFGLGARTAHF